MPVVQSDLVAPPCTSRNENQQAVSFKKFAKLYKKKHRSLWWLTAVHDGQLSLARDHHPGELLLEYPSTTNRLKLQIRYKNNRIVSLLNVKYWMCLACQAKDIMNLQKINQWPEKWRTQTTLRSCYISKGLRGLKEGQKRKKKTSRFHVFKMVDTTSTAKGRGPGHNGCSYVVIGIPK